MLAVGAGGGGLDIFSLIYHFSLLSPSLWETTRYRLKYCLKGPLSTKQPTNQSKLNDNTICFIYTFWFDKFSMSLFAFIKYNAKLFNTFDFDEFSNAINLYTLGLT